MPGFTIPCRDYDQEQGMTYMRHIINDFYRLSIASGKLVRMLRATR